MASAFEKVTLSHSPPTCHPSTLSILLLCPQEFTLCVFSLTQWLDEYHIKVWAFNFFTPFRIPQVSFIHNKPLKATSKLQSWLEYFISHSEQHHFCFCQGYMTFFLKLLFYEIWRDREKNHSSFRNLWYAFGNSESMMAVSLAVIVEYCCSYIQAG